MSRPFVLLSPHHPTTFAERGVAVPFTTPSLAGARARLAERSGLELIIANPAGGKGYYVVPWGAIQDFCRPTLHDRDIQERASTLTALSPSGIRQIAREVAGRGYAGRDARDAASVSAEQDRQAQLVTNYFLLLMLVGQIESDVPDFALERSPALEARAKRAVVHLAPRLGMEAETVAALLEELAQLFKGVGLGPCIASAHYQVLLTRVQALRADMERWAAKHSDESAALAEMICSTAALTLSCASLAVADTRSMADLLPQLLARWRSAPDSVAARASRAEWLLDGWEPICAIWEAVSGADSARHAAIEEIAENIPIQPKEAGLWFGAAVENEVSNNFRRWVELNKDWRTSLPVLDQVARNERLRSFAA